MNLFYGALYLVCAINLALMLVVIKFCLDVRELLQEKHTFYDSADVLDDEGDESYEDVHYEEVVAERELSASEKMREQWNKEFDARIAELKREVTMGYSDVSAGLAPAPELHPDVHNLPHTAVYVKPTPASLEVAE